MTNLTPKMIIIGIDFGGWDVDDIGTKQDTLGLLVVLMVFPSIATQILLSVKIPSWMIL